MSDPAEPTYEQTIQRLEALVEAMETGETPLDQLLSQYEESSRLLALCEKHLRAAELRVEKLLVEGEGIRLEPFASGATS